MPVQAFADVARRAVLAGLSGMAGSAWLAPRALAAGGARASGVASQPEVRGTWLTTTANRALASPAETVRTMRRLREIGLNTVYVEAWKNGYAQFPSEVLQRHLGVRQRPADVRQDPSDAPGEASADGPPRDLLDEALNAAHREGLLCVAWFEYGFMAAHQGTMNHLRRLKPDWLSRDAQGSEVAPNGFVWLNPLHPQARRFLTDLLLEAIERYDLDGIQLDDRIVWPYVTMGYDAFTRAAYAAEHAGREPPANPRDPSWMRWRAHKLNTLARELVAELRAARPGLLLSLSPAVFPWSYEHYLLDWPQWAKWTSPARWDELIPQAYRHSYAAFEHTWLAQVAALKAAGAYRPKELVAGLRLVGEGADSTWAQLRDSMALVRAQGQGGHVHWFSRGVLDVFADELTAWYGGGVPSPRFPANWRAPPQPLQRAARPGSWAPPPGLATGRYRVVALAAQAWRGAGSIQVEGQAAAPAIELPAAVQAAELLRDRRPDMTDPMRCRDEALC
jgi:uncharacterized lipoprotein YddW (UPF0748 family)